MGIWFWIWLVFAAVLIVGEIFTAGFFLLWFGVGSAVAAILVLLHAPLWLQWLAFVVVSGVLLAVTRRFARRVTRGTPSKVGPDRLLDAQGLVIEAIDPVSGSGMVRVERDEWRASTEGSVSIAKGRHIRVLRVDGTHLIVRPEGEGEK